MEFDEQLERYVASALPEYKEQLASLVRIPSISARSREDKTPIEGVIEAARQIAGEIGFNSSIFYTAGNPVYTGELKTDLSRPWVTVYNHLDVQPADEPEWVTKPFDPVMDDKKITGRGSTDDKGPALSILHAIRFLSGEGLPFPNIQLVYETEEEIGSPHFGQFLDQAGGSLHQPESILISDTIFEGEHPAITYRLRGLVRLHVSLALGEADRHSGLYGGALKNPATVLAQALGKCCDRYGTVTIEGIRGIPALEERDSAALSCVAEQFDQGAFRREASGELYSDSNREILERLWYRPTFEIHGWEGLQTEPGVIKTAIPSRATAKVTIRLVPGMEPEEVVGAVRFYLKGFHPSIEVTGSGVRAFETPLGSPFMAAAEEACTYGFGRKPLYVGGGGTIGAVPEFQRVYQGVPIVLVAQSLLSDGYHQPNEHFRWNQAAKGMKTMAKYLNSIAQLTV